MIAMLDTSEDLKTAERELGIPVEQLLTPLTQFKIQDPASHFAIDNGAFSGFQQTDFLSLLDRELSRVSLCRFVVVPDVVGSAIRTLETFEEWKTKLTGWPLALAIQDGQERFPVPWQNISAIFIGGTTGYKLSQHVVQIIRTAQIMGKWVHVGRVNTPGRFEYFESLGIDSIDGTGLSRFTHMRERIRKRDQNPKLF